jgi:hypothetical protein
MEGDFGMWLCPQKYYSGFSVLLKRKETKNPAAAQTSDVTMISAL